MDEEQRASERIEVGGPASLHFDGAGWSGYIENVSHKGVFFASDSLPPAVGSEVRLTCEGRAPVLARVAWTQEKGCGLVLIKPIGANAS